MLGFSVDDIIERFSPPFPNYLKIDVDGNEGRIIEGAGKTLSDPRLRSILIEVDESETEKSARLVSAI